MEGFPVKRRDCILRIIIFKLSIPYTSNINTGTSEIGELRIPSQSGLCIETLLLKRILVFMLEIMKFEVQHSTEVVHLPAHVQPQFVVTLLHDLTGELTSFGAYLLVQGSALEHWVIVVVLLGAYATSCFSECSPWTFLSILCPLFFYHRIPGHYSLLSCLLRQNSHLRNRFLEPFPVGFC